METKLALTDTELSEYTAEAFSPFSGTVNPLRSFTVECADNGRLIVEHGVKLGYKLSAGFIGNGLNLANLVRYILTHYDKLDGELYVNLRQSRLIPFTTARHEYTVIIRVTEEQTEAHLKAYTPKTYKRNRKQLS